MNYFHKTADIFCKTKAQQQVRFPAFYSQIIIILRKFAL